MIKFDKLNELKNFLQLDSRQKSFNPVRFVNVESLSDWQELKNFFDTVATNFLFLSNFCAGDDLFPNLRQLRQTLQNESRNICVLPLSEFLRINPEKTEREIKNFLSLHEGELYSFRIYFPMYRMEKFFLSMKIPDLRQNDCILLLRAQAKENYSLKIIPQAMQFKPSGNYVVGVKKYLQSCEQSPQTDLTLFTENAAHLQKKNFFDKVTVLADAFDVLKYRNALPDGFTKNFGRDEQWQRLAKLIATNENFEQAFCKEFRIDSFAASVFENLGERKNFQQWLLWLRCKLLGSGYAARCAAQSDSPEEFFAQIYPLIFSCVDDENFSELCRERRTILSLMKILPDEKFLEQVRRVDKKVALKILTKNSHAEQLFFFETLQKFKFDELDEATEILRETFPALEKYLSDNQTDAFTATQAEYFRRYRRLKITNRLTAEFNQRVTDIARSKGREIFWTDTCNKIIGEEYSDDAAIFFVDGLGAEYLNFLTADFASLAEKFTITYRVARCNLPSVTEVNKDFLAGRNVAAELLELDTLKHDSLPYPENILLELNFLSSLKEKILRSLGTYKKIILCSDHGTSRLAVLARQEKFDNSFRAEGRQVYKNGRFAEAVQGDEKIFSTAIEYDGKIIFADYSRFAQSGAPSNEIHGGATWEEIFVPVISIERHE